MTHYGVLLANSLGRAGIEVNVITSAEFLSYSLDPNVQVLPFRRSVRSKEIISKENPGHLRILL